MEIRWRIHLCHCHIMFTATQDQLPKFVTWLAFKIFVLPTGFSAVTYPDLQYKHKWGLQYKASRFTSMESEHTGHKCAMQDLSYVSSLKCPSKIRICTWILYFQIGYHHHTSCEPSTHSSWSWIWPTCILCSGLRIQVGKPPAYVHHSIYLCYWLFQLN